jgi:hypothetical protein
MNRVSSVDNLVYIGLGRLRMLERLVEFYYSMKVLSADRNLRSTYSIPWYTWVGNNRIISHSTLTTGPWALRIAFIKTYTETVECPVHGVWLPKIRELLKLYDVLSSRCLSKFITCHCQCNEMKTVRFPILYPLHRRYGCYTVYIYNSDYPCQWWLSVASSHLEYKATSHQMHSSDIAHSSLVDLRCFMQRCPTLSF